uniref:Uncharacterized protein n=1 Tax=Glossina pallidipes TaxID=7398 RepID=A0A1A9ZC40_GLOPL
MDFLRGPTLDCWKTKSAVVPSEVFGKTSTYICSFFCSLATSNCTEAIAASCEPLGSTKSAMLVDATSHADTVEGPGSPELAANTEDHVKVQPNSKVANCNVNLC